jgi:hypothetical protein
MVSEAVLRTELRSQFVFLHHLQPLLDDEGRKLNRAVCALCLFFRYFLGWRD